MKKNLLFNLYFFLMNYIISKFNNKINSLSILIILLPIFIIIGNAAINIACFLIIISRRNKI